MSREQTPVTLISSDTKLIDLAQASAAASGAKLSVVTSELRLIWRVAPAILIGADRISEVVAAALPQRERVYLLGSETANQLLCQWSMPLGAAVIMLPQGAKWLSQVIAGQGNGADLGLVVAIRSGVGGVGASTLAVGVSIAAAKDSHRVALIDGDSYGGGLDLLLGAENTSGWRWDRLRHAIGQIADITTMLPQPHGVTLVSMNREETTQIPTQAFEAVVDCLVRTHDLVIIDLPRNFEPTHLVAHRSIVVTASSVRSLAATRRFLHEVGSAGCGLVVRRGGSVSPSDAARAVELPLIGAIPTISDLPRLADRGIAPTIPGRWDKACHQILDWCLNGS